MRTAFSDLARVQALRRNPCSTAAGMLALIVAFDYLRIFHGAAVVEPGLSVLHVPLLLAALGIATHGRRRPRAGAMDSSRDARIRENAAILERHRILADMHDGLGASLVDLLHHVQSGADRHSVERKVREAIQELRIAVDALQPLDGNLATVLGNLRYRLDGTIRAAGMQVQWAMEAMPEIEGIKPWMVFAIQRILLEAVTNALKHSAAKQLRFSAQMRAATEIEIRVEDDGCGFDPAEYAGGIGLANMRARAARIGAAIRIYSAPGKGTVLTLTLPCNSRQPHRVREESDVAD